MHELDFAGVASALIQNAVDQAREGPATRLEVELGPDWIRVRDDGEGLPVHPHPFSKRPLLEVILQGPRRSEPNTLARVNASCLWLEVEVAVAHKRYRQRYEFARPLSELEPLGAAPPPGHGTVLTCAPADGAPPSFAALLDRVRELGRELNVAGAKGVTVLVRDERDGAEERVEFGPGL